MRERVVRFGPQNNLVGILTLPDNPQCLSPAVIVLDSGVMHRVGACRISVILARTLAADGHPALRFDYSGVGDSIARQDNIELEERHVIEVLEAMNFVGEQLQCDRFVLHGLCSGAREAFAVAVRDARVVGISQIDSHAYQNLRWYVNYYGPRLLQLPVWKIYIGKLLKKLAPRSTPAKVSEPAVDDDNMIVGVWPEQPPKDAVEQGYLQLVKRGVRFYVVFTGSWNYVYNYANQFFDMYPKVNFDDSVDLRYLPDSSHILSEPGARLAVVQGCRDLLRDLRGDT